MLEEEDEVKKPVRQPIRLRRSYNVQQKIAENLKPLQNISRKKQRAQAIYYGTLGRSPLHASTPINDQAHKQPVHERLGFGNEMFVRKNQHTNKNFLQKQHPLWLRRANVTNGFVAAPLKRGANLAQRRLLRIRQQESVARRVIRLRRRPFQPANYKLNVSNTEPLQQRHSILASLNLRCQAEIRIIQEKNKRMMHFITGENLLPMGVGVTGLYLHDRFSQLV